MPQMTGSVSHMSRSVKNLFQLDSCNLRPCGLLFPLCFVTRHCRLTLGSTEMKQQHCPRCKNKLLLTFSACVGDATAWKH